MTTMLSYSTLETSRIVLSASVEPQKGSTGSVLKTTTAYGSSSNSSDRNSLAAQISRISSGDFDARSIDSEESEKQPAEPTSVHEMRAHHQCCRLNNNNSNNTSSPSNP
ncbi:hypothetical protein ACTXT7_000625 [Hymenolepis weldensis]